MDRKLVHISLLVDDYDKAIAYYTRRLDFDLISDVKLSETKRWVLVRPKGSGNCSILLAKADGEIQHKFIGNQSGNRVFLFLHTDNFDRDYKLLIDNEVRIIRQPSAEIYGKVLVFEDIYGNKWDLIQPDISI